MKETLIAVLAATSVAVASGQSPASSPGSETQTIRNLLAAGEYVSAELAAKTWRDGLQQTSFSSSSEAATDLLVEALVANGKGGAPDTLSLARTALASRQTPEAADPAGAAVALRNLADVHSRHDGSATLVGRTCFGLWRIGTGLDREG